MTGRLLLRFAALAAVALVPCLASAAVDRTTDVRLAADRRAIEFVEDLESLGLTPEGFALLDQIEAAALEGDVASALIEEAAWLTGDPTNVDKLRDTLTAYAEARAYGQPLSVGADLLPPIWKMPGSGNDELLIGGTCLSCPSQDFPASGCIVPPSVAATDTQVLTGAGDCALYCFSVVSGRQYTFETCGGSTNFDTVLELLSKTAQAGPPAYAACQQIVASDDACTTASRIIWCATFTGDAILRVRGSGSAFGTYTLSYRESAATCPCPASSQCSSATPLGTPSTTCALVLVTTTSTCRSQFFEFNLTAGNCYVFTTCSQTCTGAGAPSPVTLDPRMFLHDSGCGSIVASNANFCGALPQITFVPTVSGVYKLEVNVPSGPGGTVTLGYRQCTRTCGACTAPRFGPFTPNTTCQSHASAIDVCGSDNFYAFNLTSSPTCTYTFSTCASTACSGSAGFDTVLELFNPASSCSTVIASNDNATGCGTASVLTVGSAVITTSGTYILRVRPLTANVIGSYTLAYVSTCSGGPICTAPSGLSAAPTTGPADASCNRTETFTLNAAAGTGPITYQWTINSPPGGSATPAMGSVVGPAMASGPVTFSSALHGGCGGGTFTINVVATNSCGMTSGSFSYTLIDSTQPTISAPGNTTIRCDQPMPPNSATASDNCDPNPALVMTQTTITVGCPDRRVVTRTWTATDCASNMATAVQVITITDNVAPVLLGVPASGTAECDSVPSMATVTASDNCDPNPTVTSTEVSTPGSCPGQYTIVRTWTATDRCGNTTTESQTIDVVDTTPPDFTPAAANELACIWSPNHDYVCIPSETVLAGLTATDACSGPVTFAIVGLVSDQPDDSLGDGHTNMDVQPVGPDGLLCVRSERLGNDRDGRRYYVLAVAVDACNNASDPVTAGYISVRHDSRLLGHNRGCIRSTPPRHSRGRGNGGPIVPPNP